MIIRSVTNFGRSGVADWFLQRVSAVILLLYILWLVGYACVQPMDHASWKALFHSFFVQMASLFALMSLLIHAWIGMWTVATDYLKPPAMRITFEVVVILSLGAFFLWGVHILWS